MKFVHTADIHLDIPFRTLSERADLGEIRRIEQKKAFKKMIDDKFHKKCNYIYY